MRALASESGFGIYIIAMQDLTPMLPLLLNQNGGTFFGLQMGIGFGHGNTLLEVLHLVLETARCRSSDLI